MLSRVCYLVKVYLLTVVAFVLAKVVFMCYHTDIQDFGLKDVIGVVAHGVTLDLSMSLYILSVPFLCIAASIWYPKVSGLRSILRPYYALIAVAMALAFVADTSLYEFWQFKLDASCLQYLETPTEAMASVTTGYILLRLFAVVLTACCITYAYWRIPLLLPAVRRRILASMGALLLIPLIIIGIRGGLGESTTNIGQVYYSQNQFLNHAAVNPVFSFFASFEKTATNVVYHFMDDTESQRIVDEYYDTRSIDTDTLLTTRHPNIIVILMESCGSVFTEVGGNADVTPNLNRLMHEGIYFANCYGNTWRTDRGTLCTWSGYPSFPTMSVMKMPAKSRTMPCIAKSLQREGYHTFYLYGGDINFTNMRGYLVGCGFEQLIWKDDYSVAEQRSAQWGVRDGITFKTLFEQALIAPQPFLIGYSTLSSHQPWDVPIHHFDDEKLNAFYYLDLCIGRFIQQLRQSPLWKNTLVVMLPDHGILYQGLTESDPLLNQIPMLWTGGAVKQPRRIETLCNQTDLPATLLGQLGISHEDFTYSRDILSKSYTKPFAIHTYDDGVTMIDSTSFINYDFISNKMVTQKGPRCDSLLHRAKAILQVASKDLDKR